MKGDDSKQFHVGYFRDEPKSMPAFLASNSAAKNGVFTQVAENIFGAVKYVYQQSDAVICNFSFLKYGYDFTVLF